MRRGAEVIIHQIAKTAIMPHGKRSLFAATSNAPTDAFYKKTPLNTALKLNLYALVGMSTRCYTTWSCGTVEMMFCLFQYLTFLMISMQHCAASCPFGWTAQIHLLWALWIAYWLQPAKRGRRLTGTPRSTGPVAKRLSKPNSIWRCSRSSQTISLSPMQIRSSRNSWWRGNTWPEVLAVQSSQDEMWL